MPMGVAMGLTAVALIYSPPGRRSGAHMNPAVTLTFFRLGKISAVDAVAYVGAQFAGGAAGICLAILVFRRFAADAAVNYVATMPGSAGAPGAFAGEVVISFETAQRQAGEHSRRLDDELAQLLFHGILHVLGYDHVDEDEEKVMKGKEEALLRA